MVNKEFFYCMINQVWRTVGVKLEKVMERNKEKYR